MDDDNETKTGEHPDEPKAEDQVSATNADQSHAIEVQATEAKHAAEASEDGPPEPPPGPLASSPDPAVEAVTEIRHYSDGSSATGPGPLPLLSPEQQKAQDDPAALSERKPLPDEVHNLLLKGRDRMQMLHELMDQGLPPHHGRVREIIHSLRLILLRAEMALSEPGV